MSGDVESLTQLMADVNRPEILSQVTRGLNNTGLHLAAEKRHVEFVCKLLLLKPCILSVANSRQETALHVAARNGATKVVEVLLQIACESDAQCRRASCVQLGEQNPIHSQRFFRAQNPEGNTALHMAAQGGYPYIVDLLLEKDKGLACLVNKAREAPLFTAAKNGHLGIVKRLLGICTYICGRNPLPEAIRTRRWGVVNELLDERPALANQADRSGLTPLHLAVEGGHLETVRKILEKHTEACYAVNDYGMSAIHIAARNGHKEIVGELLRWNPDCIELLNGDGKTALHLAVESDEWDVACYLLKNNGTSFLINQPDGQGNTILHTTMSRLSFITDTVISEKKKGEIVEMLRTMLSISGLSVNAKNNMGRTALDIHDYCVGEFGDFPYRKHLTDAGAVREAKW